MALAEPLRADTITCLRNSGAERRERRDNAILARPGRTKAGTGTRDEVATVNAANELTTGTEYLRRVRKAHCVSLRDSEFASLFLSEHRREKIVVHDSRLQLVYWMYPFVRIFTF